MNCFKIAGLAGCLLFSQGLYAGTKIKVATLAPQESTWMEVMNSFSKEVSQKTGGEVEFKVYAGGVQGDEKDVIKKIRLGQLHGGGFTGVGIGVIAPEVRVLDAPFLFKSEAEIDYIHSQFDDEFRKMLQAHDYVLIGWAEVGFVYLFTNTPVSKAEDLKSVKMWMWEGDPMAEAVFKALQVSPVSLSVTDVMTSLQTGLVDGVYGSPLSVVAMQWFTRTKYMFSLPIVNASGALLVSRKMFSSLTPDQQKIVLELGSKYFGQLTARSREDNKKSITALKGKGITVTSPSGGAAARFEDMGRQARYSLAGRLYPESLLSRIEAALAGFRKKK